MDELTYYRKTLEAISKLFISMHVFDLKEGTYTTIKTNEHILKWSQGFNTMQEILTNVMVHIAKEDSLAALLQFIKFEDLFVRLQNKDSVSCVFEGKVNGWCTARFIKLDENPIRYVVFAVENVDAQTRALELIKKNQAETVKAEMLVKALIDDYSTVAAVDVEHDTIEMYKMNGRVTEMMSDTWGKTEYTSGMKLYLERAVHPDDREKIREFFELERLKEQIALRHSFYETYRNNLGRYGEVKVVPTSDHTALLGFAEKHEEIEAYNRQLYTDSLAKVHNRRYLDDVLADTECTGVIMVDIDKFKEINDNAGHQCGDAAIEAVANALKHAVRATDHVLRYGGDEFMIVFPDAPRDVFELKMELMRQAVERLRLEEYPEVKLTISLGGTYGSGTVKGMLAEADRALYESKKTRNICSIRNYY